MQNNFKELRKLIDQKEQELLNESDEYLTKQTSQLEDKMRELKDHIEQVDATLDIFDSKQSDPNIFSLLHYYSKRKPAMEELIEKYQTYEVNMDLPKCYLDLTTVNNQVDQINSVKLSLQSLENKEEKEDLRSRMDDDSLSVASRRSSPRRRVVRRNDRYHQ
eukprot:TRINITY_DN2904_c0_g1_i4.p2 TRINITY_DN2904_c0_g1~~TRINITY_DN2904_c0_g1_i4.p2  ORF type:complete len:162 (+),score=57.71 TRINITY_DN2904_c0_g1_i4:551-1036(+)